MQSRNLLFSFVFVALASSAMAQRLHTDCLNRGLIAIPVEQGVYCSWRIQADEYYDTQYNLYRNGQKVNDVPLSVSNYTVTDASASDQFSVRAIVRGVEQEASEPVSVWQHPYLEIVPKHDPLLTSRYIPNDACCADVDGDGEVEILLKYDNDSEISASYPREGHNGEYSLFECLKLDGTVLWWVNCGPNMGDFQNNEQNIVAYDWDGDGRAEAIFRAADGTTIHMADGETYVVGDPTLNYRAATGGGTNWFMHSGAEFLLYVDGQTGKPYQCIDYPLPRLEDDENPQHLLSGGAYDALVNTAWGDGYGHRSSKHFFGAPYLDGVRPSIFLGRGIYTQHKFVAFDVDPDTHELVERWRWVNKNPGPWFAQGYHNYSIADVDLDGRDEIVWGSMVIDDCGLGLSTTGLGHGDAHHVGDFNPYVHGLEGFFCNEDEPANNYRDMTTSKIYYRLVDTSDAGRAMAGNFTDDFPGAIGWGAHDTPISTVTNGHVDGMHSNGLTQNFRVYWDGDLLDECFDGAVVYKYGQGQIRRFEGALTNNSTKATPSYQGDILGDWREEYILRTSAGNIRIYATTDPTPWRNYSLWYDHQYRNAMVWQMCGYNQPPHVSYFLGQAEGITQAPPPLTLQGRTQVGDAGVIGRSLDGHHVLVSETHDASIAVEDGASPWVMTFNVPSWVRGSAPNHATQKETPIYTQYFSLNVTGGAFAGSTRLVKQGDGVLLLPAVTQAYTGSTDIWAGTLSFDGAMPNSRVWLNRFATLSSSGGSFSTIQADYASTIHPGGMGQVGTMSADSLLLGFGARVVFDHTAAGLDLIEVNVLGIEKKTWQHGPAYSAPVFQLVATEGLAPGRYPLIRVSTIVGDIHDVVIEGLKGQKTSLSFADGCLCLDVADTRDAESIVWTGAVSSVWDLDDSPNFSSSTQTFVSGDHVTFDDSAVTTDVVLSGELSPASVLFANESRDYTLGGDGFLSGDMKLVKQGSGVLHIQNVNAYTGGTQILGGVIEPSMLANRDGQNHGSLGALNSGILLDNLGTLRTTANLTNSQTIKLGLGNGVMDVSGTLIQNGAIQKQHSGSHGSLYKVGTGTLQLDGTLQCDTVFLDKGTLYDFADNHFDNTVIVFGSNGTLRYNNSIYSYSSDRATFVVPEGCTGTLYPDGRCDYSGKLYGAGTLNLHATWVRLYFQGDWSQFTGTIKAFQDAKTGNYEPTFEFNNAYGLGLATLNIQAGCTVYTNGKNFAIGELTGSGSIRNDGAKGSSANTLTIGGKNTDFSYGGTIVGTNVTKVGDGRWSVSNTTSLASARTVNVNAGSLHLNSTSATTSMTGANVVTVNAGGALTGKGVVQGLVLQSGAEYRPGTASADDKQSGTLRSLGDLEAKEGSHIYLNIQNAKDNSASRSWVDAAGQLILNGTLHLTYRTGGSYQVAAGDSATLLIATKGIVGTPTLDLQSLPDGLVWDTSTLLTDGVIRVAAASGIQQVMADTSTLLCSVYDIAGNLMAQFCADDDADIPVLLRQQGLHASVYLVRVRCGDSVSVHRFTLR